MVNPSYAVINNPIPAKLLTAAACPANFEAEPREERIYTSRNTYM